MLEDSDRLLGTIEQVLRAGQLGARRRRASRTPVDLRAHRQRVPGARADAPSPAADALTYRESLGATGRAVRARRRGRAARRWSRISSTTPSSTPGPQVRVAVELEQTDAAHAHAARPRSGHRHLAVRAEADLQALLPHSRRDGDARSKAPASACSSSARSSRATAARCSPRATGPAAAARSPCSCRSCAPQ